MTGFVDLGYRAVKMKVGWPGAGLRHDAERVRAVREAIGPDVDLMVDVNNAWDANTAIRFGRMIERYEPYWLEEPTPADDYRGQAAICTALDVPVASGENEFTRWGFRDLLDARAVDIVQADPRTCGGFTEWLKIAALASAYHLPMAPHGGPHVGAHCVGAVSNGLIVESYVHSIQAHLNEFVAPAGHPGRLRHPARPPGAGLAVGRGGDQAPPGIVGSGAPDQSWSRASVWASLRTQIGGGARASSCASVSGPTMALATAGRPQSQARASCAGGVSHSRASSHQARRRLQARARGSGARRPWRTAGGSSACRGPCPPGCSAR